MIIGLSPVRISFAGGGTDLPEYFDKYGGSVVNTAITKFTYTIIHPRHDDSLQAFSPDFQRHYKPTSYEKIHYTNGTEIATSTIKFFNYKKGINIIIGSDVPAGSGLGASSSLMVNMVNLVSKQAGKKLSSTQIAETAFNIGRNVLHWPIGKQDEYIAAFGGFNHIKFSKNKVSVNPLRLKKKTLHELEKNLLLFFVGHTRDSSKILTKQIDRIEDKNPDTINSLEHVKILADEMAVSLKKSDITKFGELLHKGWSMKKKFAKNVSNVKIDKLYNAALRNGALGGKITGAGGGGHMLFYCEQRKQKNLIKKLQQLGLRKIDFHFYNEKPKILDTENYI